MVPLLSTAYLPPILYVAACVKSGEIVIEKHEHFIKQTQRNRALIYGANGVLPLIIPVQHTNLSTIPLHEVKIAYDSDWQKIHWRSMVSAYRNSSFFDYYEDDFGALYHRHCLTLFEFNLELLNILFRLLRADVIVSFTSSYQKDVPALNDVRSEFHFDHPVLQQPKTPEISYRQVFSSKYGFIHNLSVVDLLFNEGPKSMHFLRLIAQ